MELYMTFTSLNGLSLFLPMLGIEPKALCMTYKHSTIELYPQQLFPHVAQLVLNF